MEGKVFVIMALPACTIRREALSGIMFLLNQRHSGQWRYPPLRHCAIGGWSRWCGCRVAYFSECLECLLDMRWRDSTDAHGG
jgi:hypothetical protein